MEERSVFSSAHRLPAWWRYAAAAAAALVLVLVGVLIASALSARGGSQGFAATVVPPAPAAQSSSGSQAQGQAAPVAGAATAADSRSLAPAAGQNVAGIALPAPYPIVGGSCSTSPTVQFQGRGLAATGTASVSGAEQQGTISVSVQQTGSDAAGALAAIQSKIAAVRSALSGAGVPASSVQVSYYRYGGPQFTAYASIQATVTGGIDVLTAATNAVAQIPGVSSYSQSSPVAAAPTPEEVQNAVGRAAAQARDMAESTAQSAGVRLGDLQGIVAQPPVLCYGASGPERVVEVTATYAIK